MGQALWAISVDLHSDPPSKQKVTDLVRSLVHVMDRARDCSSSLVLGFGAYVHIPEPKDINTSWV